jgi:hypothetical protein
MKKLLWLLLILPACKNETSSTVAAADAVAPKGGQELSITGMYQKSHEVRDDDLGEESCRNSGKWKDGYCNVRVLDQITIFREGDLYDLTVGTNGHNGDGCYFSAAEARLVGNRLTAKDGTCEVTAIFDSNKVNITTSESGCNEFCGTQAELALSGAKKLANVDRKIVGTFVSRHAVREDDLDQEECKRKKGKWDGKCTVKVEDEVIITKLEDHYEITISTNGHNGDGCFYIDSNASWTGQILQSSQANCRISATFTRGKVSISHDQSDCDSFCGTQGSIDVSDARKRIKKQITAKNVQ